MRKHIYLSSRKNESPILWIIIISIFIMILIIFGFESSGKEELKKIIVRNMSYSLLSNSSGLLSYIVASDENQMNVSSIGDRLSFRKIINSTSMRKALASEKTNYLSEDYQLDSYIDEDASAGIGYNVIHDKTTYDVANGYEDRNKAYNYAKVGLENMLEKHPSIEVIIDLHRDDGAPRTVVIDGKETAKIMLFNGLSRDQNGPLPNHDNPFVQDNLAFGFQLQLESFDLYPGFFMKNYLKCYRYNLHMRPKSLLIELGTVNNTLESAKNAMEPFAHLLDRVLQGETSIQ